MPEKAEGALICISLFGLMTHNPVPLLQEDRGGLSPALSK